MKIFGEKCSEILKTIAFPNCENGTEGQRGCPLFPYIEHQRLKTVSCCFATEKKKKKKLVAEERTTTVSSLHFLYVNSKLGRQHTRRRWQPLSVQEKETLLKLTQVESSLLRQRWAFEA